MKAQVDQTYAALRFDMQFSASRRSFREAKPVTVLAELAFICILQLFLPSISSMSLDELRNDVPIQTQAALSLQSSARSDQPSVSGVPHRSASVSCLAAYVERFKFL